MPTRPSSAASEVLADIQSLLKKITPAVLKTWAAEDKKKKKTGGVNASFVKSLLSDLTKLDGASSAASTKKKSAAAATSKEKSAREPLRAALKSLRADVEETFPDDVALQRAFGRGQNLDTNSTTILLQAAGGVVAAFAADGDGVKSAGVTAARVAEIKKLRDTLASADTTQRTEIGERIGATSAKSTLYKSIVKRATQLRKRLGRDGATKLTSSRRRHTVKKRAKKGTGAPGDGTATPKA